MIERIEYTATKALCYICCFLSFNFAIRYAFYEANDKFNRKEAKLRAQQKRPGDRMKSYLYSERSIPDLRNSIINVSIKRTQAVAHPMIRPHAKANIHKNNKTGETVGQRKKLYIYFFHHIWYGTFCMTTVLAASCQTANTIPSI